MSQALAFLGIAAAVIVTPGPDTALTIRNALLGGRRGGFLTAAGVATGQATWAFFTAAGVASLLEASQPAFLVLRVAGAGYLVYVGLQSLLAAWRARSRESASGVADGRRLPPAAAYRQGLLGNLSNPKMAVFFISLLPQFAGGASFVPLLSLGLLFCTMTLAWLAAYALVVDRAGDFLRRRPVRRVLDAAAGFVLVALGLRLMSERS